MIEGQETSACSEANNSILWLKKETRRFCWLISDTSIYLISSLPVSEGLLQKIRNYNGHWIPEQLLLGVMAFSERFKVCDTDIIVASLPKCGTTWLKALAFATVTRKDHNPSAPDHPLRSTIPHDAVLNAERIFLANGNFNKLDDLTAPRLFSTHMPHDVLRESVASSKCRIVYVCRDPKDTVVSTWHFLNAMVPQGEDPIPFGEAFEVFCNGKSPYGPIWDHCLGYWRESVRRPDRVLFLKYEEMKEDPMGSLRRLAEFVGCPFSPEEETDGMSEKIVDLCSFNKLSSIEGNDSRAQRLGKHVVKNSYYYRRGQVGDWQNYLTPEMAQKLDHITEEKLHGSGFTFGIAKAG